MPGVLILGASRSGTSMTAGLLARHGVFFGDCMGADRRNAKGYFENLWWKQVEHGRQQPRDFDAAWKAALQQQGWDGRQPWGAKVGAQWFDGYWRHVPDVTVIVCCYRPQAQIEASRADAGFNSNRQPISCTWAIMDGLAEAGWPVVKVWTDRLVAGELDQIRPAFDRLELTLDEATACAWIDPDLWRHGARR